MKRQILILLSLLALPVLAQQNQSENSAAGENEKLFEEKVVARAFVNPIPANNEQYFNNWTNGEITLTSGSVIKNEMLRYNCFLDELLWIRKTDYLIGVVFKSNVSEFVLYEKDTNKKQLFRNMRIKNWIGNDSTSFYLQVLHEGKVSLYGFRKAQKISSFNELVRKDEYYLFYNGEYHKFKPNRYNLYKILNETDKQKMKEAIRSEHLKVKHESQLIRALEIYNSK